MNTTLQRKSKRNTQVLRRYRMRRFGAVALVAASLMGLFRFEGVAPGASMPV